MDLFDTTQTALERAMSGTSARQAALAQNLANANTPGYQRISVSFESRLAALQDGSGQVATPSLADLSNFRPSFETAASAAPVALDMELAELSETTLRHQTLLKALNKHLALMSLAITEGKR